MVCRSPDLARSDPAFGPTFKGKVLAFRSSMSPARKTKARKRPAAKRPAAKSARAMWKGVISFGSVALPVRLYSAVQDRDVHFRLLHQTDKQPVKQVMINPETEEVVPSEQI